MQRETRVVDNGDIVTSAGVAAGIDMAFHIVARLLGPEAAEEAAHYMEYPWTRAKTAEVQPGSRAAGE